MISYLNSPLLLYMCTVVNEPESWCQRVPKELLRRVSCLSLHLSEVLCFRNGPNINYRQNHCCLFFGTAILLQVERIRKFVLSLLFLYHCILSSDFILETERVRVKLRLWKKSCKFMKSFWIDCLSQPFCEPLL